MKFTKNQFKFIMFLCFATIAIISILVYYSYIHFIFLPLTYIVIYLIIKMVRDKGLK